MSEQVKFTFGQSNMGSQLRLADEEYNQSVSLQASQYSTLLHQLPESSRAQKPRAFKTIFSQKKTSSLLQVIYSPKSNIGSPFHAKPLFKNPGVLMHPGEDTPDPSSELVSLLSCKTNLKQVEQHDSVQASRIRNTIHRTSNPFSVESPLQKFDRIVNKQFRTACRDSEKFDHPSTSGNNNDQIPKHCQEKQASTGSKDISPIRIVLSGGQLPSKSPKRKQDMGFADYWRHHYETKNRVIVPILKKEGKQSPVLSSQSPQMTTKVVPKCLKFASREIMYLYDPDS